MQKLMLTSMWPTLESTFFELGVRSMCFSNCTFGVGFVCRHVFFEAMTALNSATLQVDNVAFRVWSIGGIGT